MAQPATDVLPLSHGQTIAIGEVRLRFQMDDDADEAETLRADEHHLAPVPQGRHQGTRDRRPRVAIHFMNQSLNETSPDELVTRALRLVLAQSGADHVGYLSLEDPDALQFVLPAESKVDRDLSRRLTRLVGREAAAWSGCATPRPGRSAATA